MRAQTDLIIAQNYRGVCRQSNRGKDFDPVKRFTFNKLRRRLKLVLSDS
jgi:hypothetical protein